MFAHIQLGVRELGLRFLANSTAVVDAAYAAALAHAGTDAGPPGLRDRYARDFYAAYCQDPEGHKLCFVHTDDTGTRAAPTLSRSTIKNHSY